MTAGMALLASTFTPRPASADAHAETAAKDALQKAENDFLRMNYAGGAIRLQHAVRVCGPNRCSHVVKGTLLRDLGTMQFRSGDKTGAAKSWAEALALQPGLALNPDYDAADVGAAWEDARAVAGLPAGPVTSKPPPRANGGPDAGGPGAAPGSAAAAGGPEEDADCPPGLPGCVRKKSAAASHPSEPSADKRAGENQPVAEPKEPEAAVHDGGAAETEPEAKYPRLWVGVSVAIDFLSMSAASDVCKLDSNTGVPLKSGYFCYDSANGVDFPRTRAANEALDTAARGRGAGTTVGGLQLGDIRVMLAVDYALLQNVLVGARLGYAFNAYPGSAAVRENHAITPVHLEARVSYLLGHSPLSKAGLAPMGFLGFGISEFDGHQTTTVTFKDGRAQPPVDVWLTDAPFFIVLGLGARYQAAPRVALTGALRLNTVIGGNGFMLTYGPELGVLYGF
jgi:hypothetical protein